DQRVGYTEFELDRLDQNRHQQPVDVVEDVDQGQHQQRVMGAPGHDALGWAGGSGRAHGVLRFLLWWLDDPPARPAAHRPFRPVDAREIRPDCLVSTDDVGAPSQMNHSCNRKWVDRDRPTGAAMKLENKLAFDSVAAQGIGPCKVHQFVEQGATVYPADINEEAFRDSVSDLEGRAHAVVCNVMDEASVQAD